MIRSRLVPALQLAVLATALWGTATPAQADVIGPRETVVILTSSDAEDSRFTQALARANVFTDPKAPARFYAENSQGRVTLAGRDNPAGDVLGPYLATRPARATAPGRSARPPMRPRRPPARTSRATSTRST